MRIRPATPEDFEAISAISDSVNLAHHQAVPGLFLHPADIGDCRKFWFDHLSGEDQLFLVADSGEGISGFITAKISENHQIPYFTADPICRIGTIAVSADQRRRGIGRKLMTAAEDWAREQGAREIHLAVMDFNKDAQSFYEAQGYGLLTRTLHKPLTESSG